MKIIEFRNTIIVFLIATLIVVGITFHTKNENGISLYHDRSFFINILVEAHGMLLDLLLVGLIILFFISKAERKQEISKLKNEIDYIRLLKTDETKYKIKALINQLNDLKSFDIDLHQCTFNSLSLLGIKIKKGKIHAVDFSNCNLTNSSFHESKGERTLFIKSKLTNVNFEKSKLLRCKFMESNSRDSKFKKSLLIKCNFNNADLNNSDFRECNLSDSSFVDSDLRNCDFRGANLKGVDFTNSILQSANFQGCSNFTLEQIKSSKNYKKIKTDVSLSSFLEKIT